MKTIATILIVDDETRNLDVLESLLQSPDYNLVRALKAEDALGLLLERDFAAIVLDVQMPGMSGIELANLIKQRKRTQHIPIIFLTAHYQEDKDVLQGYGTGAVDYLTKPINPQILKSKIAVFVDLFQKTQALAISEEALRQVNVELEARVQARTAELTQLNEELRQREAAVRASEAQAQAASRAKDDFLAALSHELRTPLNPVLLLASEAAENTALPFEVRADFDLIAKNVAMEARLIDDLLDLTRITRGRLALELRPFDVNAVLRDSVELVQPELDEKHLSLKFKLEAEAAMVLGDDVRLKQIFWNVLKNAVKFTPEGGRITVATSVGAGDRITITVTDSGIGMTADEIGRIFEAFSQGEHASRIGNHRFGGMGLGLAISRKLVELHSGSITATSPGRNRGSAFTIDLPLLSSNPSSPVAELAPEPKRTLSTAPADKPPRRILLVEDHNPTRYALAYLLRHREYEVVSAACLNEARAMAEREPFDLLISDIGLPDGSGYDLMKELRERNGSRVVGIALTGYGMENDVDRSRTAGFAIHLTKPVTAQALDRALFAASNG